MYFRVLAVEDSNTVTVLSYAPGPLVTDMLSQILEQALPEIRQEFQGNVSQTYFLCENRLHL